MEIDDVTYTNLQNALEAAFYLIDGYQKIQNSIVVRDMDERKEYYKQTRKVLEAS